MEKAKCRGLLGFAVHRTDHEENEAYWLEGLKTFEETDPGFGPGNTYQTNFHPIQDFNWSDYTAKPGYRYTYLVQALEGTPSDLKVRAEVSVEIQTESEEGGDHDIFFNRGATASQEYARRFNNKRPGKVYDPADKRWEWLSRGAFESILNFVSLAKSASFGLRVAAYEFRLPPFADALKQAVDRGADVQIIYDGNANPPDEKTGEVFPRDENRETAKNAKVKGKCTERLTKPTVQKPPISHHKFIVLLKNKKPVAVLLGSTNFSLGGAFGQSNVVHIVQNQEVAARYLECWNLISENPEHEELQEKLTQLRNIPVGKPPIGTSVIFSPRQDLAALEWYAKLAAQAANGLFMTFAFGMNKLFMQIYQQDMAGLRYAMMDKLLRSGIKKENKPAAEAEMLAMRMMRSNRVAVGNRIVTNSFDRWTVENLTGPNSHVQFVHTKFMLIDPLSDDPIVITGSANFSDASSNSNDENMIVIRGNKRVADIYLGEYMRLWNHYAFRSWLAAQQEKSQGGGIPPNPDRAGFKHLDASGKHWWKRHFGDTDQNRERLYFSGSLH